MPEEVVVPEIDTSSPAAMDSSMDALGAVSMGIGMGIAAITAAETRFAADPCMRLTRLQNQQIKAWRAANRMLEGVTFWAAENQAAASQAVKNWGRPSSGVTGGKPFSVWLIDHNLVPALVLPVILTIGAALPGIIITLNNQAPSNNGWNRPSSSNSSAQGIRLGPGVYVHNGRLRGSRVVTAWEDWKDYQLANAYAIGTGRPNWRSRLLQWVGQSSTAPRWKVWLPGDPVQASSKVGNAIEVAQMIDGMVEEAAIRCSVQNMGSRMLGADTGSEPPAVAPPAEEPGGFEAEHGAALGVFAGLGVVAWLLSR